MGCSGSNSVKVIVPFVWGNSGSVLIKSSKLVLTYDSENRNIQIKVPNDKMTESLMTWKDRKFTLQDIYINDLKLNKRYKCPEIKAQFTISEYDQFQDLVDKKELLEKIKSVQNKQIDNQKSEILLSGIRNDCKDLWDFSKEFWIKNKNLAPRNDLVHFGRDCFSTSIEKRTDPSKIQDFLRKKYRASNFVKLKKDVKAKVVMEKDKSRPHIVKIRKSGLTNFFVEAQHLFEIQEEIKVYIFCWDDIPELGDFDFISSEMKKMQSGTKLVYNDLQQEIDNMMNVA